MTTDIQLIQFKTSSRQLLGIFDPIDQVGLESSNSRYGGVVVVRHSNAGLLQTS